jgi:hypothetical protein
MAHILSRIGDAVVALIKEKNAKSIPVGSFIVVDLKGWEDPAPRLELLRCPANPTASWAGCLNDEGREGTGENYEASLDFIDLAASLENPAWKGAPAELYPHHYINSGFHPVTSRFWAEEKDDHERAPNLYLPEPGLAATWPKLAGIPNVTVHLSYTIWKQGARRVYWDDAHVVLASRFEETAVRDSHYICVNPTLFDQPPPIEWTTGKQFGDEKKRPRRSARTKRPAHRATPLGVNPKERED